MKLLWILLTSISSIIIAQVTLHPSDRLVVVPGGNVTFTCVYSTPNSQESILSIQWLVNSSSFEDFNLTNVMSEFTLNAGGIGALNFFNLIQEYNNTSIQCIATLSSGQDSSSRETILLLQGTLSAVGSLNLAVPLLDTIIFLSWTAPFTMDITSVDPDISGYCVDVVNSTSLSILHSECGINVTEFSYPIASLNSSGCDDYLLVVTPVNTAGNGTQSSITYFQALASPRVVSIEGRKIVPLLSPTAQISHILYTTNLTAPVCSAEMAFVDQNTQEHIIFNQLDVNILWTNIIFTSEKLLLNRIYSVMVTASNVRGSATSNIEISTHDIADVQIMNNNIKTKYLLSSEAAGGLVMFMFISDDVNIDFSESFFLPLGKNVSHNYTLPFQLMSGFYLFTAYDIERNGTLLNRIIFPAVTNILTVVADGNVKGSFNSSDIKDCNVANTQDVVSALCTFSINSTSTGFLMIVQRNNISKVRVLHVNQSRQGLAHEPVTVQVQENGVYYVTIFPVREETGIVGSNVGYSKQITLSNTPSQPDFTNSTVTITSVGIGLGVFALIAFVLGVLILVVLCQKMKSEKAQSFNVKIQPDLPLNSASNRGSPIYEEIGEAATSFTYTHNTLYGASTGVAPLPEEEDDIKLAASDTSLSGDTCQMRQCPAYGCPAHGAQ